MFKALGLYEENAEIKKSKGGRKRGRRETERQRERKREKGSENYEGHGPMLQKNTHKHRISHTISEISWISFIRIYES